MKVSATIKNKLDQHKVVVQTNDAAKEVSIPPRATGYGSSLNGAELLLLSLATCFCNDIYREAAKRNIKVSGIDVEFTGEFGAEGEPGFNFQYKAQVDSDAPAEEIEKLVEDTDKIAEIHKTLRQGLNITLMK